MGDEKRIICPHCEAKLEADSRFCNYCGNPLAETEKKTPRRRKPRSDGGGKQALVMISKVDRALKSAKKSGADVDSIQVALDHVRRVLSEGDHKEAERKAKILLRKSKEAHERRKKELMILNARLFVEKARELGADVAEASDFIKKAETALEEGIFGDVVEFVRNSRKEAMEAKRKRRARVMIQNFKPKLDYAHEMGADIDVAKEYLRSAEESLERGVYGEVQEYLKLARTEVKEVKRFKRASDLVERAEEALNSARVAGADTSKSGEIIHKAKDALQRREFDEVKALTKEAGKQAARETGRKEVETSLESMSQEIEYIKSIEIDITRAESIATKVREALEKGDTQRARRYLSQLKTWLTKEKKELGATDEDVPIQMLGVSKRLRDIREIVDDIRKVGVDISHVEELFEEAMQASQERNVAKSEEILSEIEDMAMGLRESLAAAAKDLLAKAKKEAEDARKDKLNIGSAGETVRNGLRALERGRIDEALQYAEIARNLVERARKERVVDLAKGSLLRMEVIIADSKKMDLNVEDAEAIYRQASSQFEKGEYGEVEDYVSKVDLSAKKAKRLFITSKAQDELEGASFAIDDVERMGADVSDVKSILRKAREELFEENYDAVMELSRRIRDMVGEAEKEKIIQRFGTKSKGIATMMAGAKALGIDIEHADSLLTMADEYLKKEEIVQAKDLIRRAEVSAGKKIQDFIKDRYPKLLVSMPTKGFQADVWNRLILEIINEGNLRSEEIDIDIGGDFEVKGLETIPEIDPNEKRKIEVGVKPKKDGDIPLDLSVSYRRPFDNQVFRTEELKQLSVKSYGTYVVEDVFLVHNDGRLIGHETRKFREDIDEDIFSGMLTIVQDFVKDSFRKRSEGGLKRLDFGGNMIVIERGPHVYLACVVAGDEPTFLPLHMVEVIGEIEEEYGGVLEGWSGMLTELDGIDEMIRRLMYVSDAANADLEGLEKSAVVRTIDSIEEARKAGADITHAETLIQDAMQNMDKQDWKKAWNLVREAEESANTSRVQYIASVEDQLAAAKEIVDKANEFGIRMEEAEELFEIATQAINSGQFSTISSVTKRIEELISQGNQEIQRLESEKDLREARLLVQAAKQEGLDVFDAERLLRSAESSYHSSDVDTASDLLSDVGSVVEKSRKKRWKEDVKKRVDSLASVVSNAKEAGLDVAELTRLLDEVRNSLESDDVNRIDALLERLEASVREVQKKLLFSSAEKRLEELATLVERATEAGLEVDEEVNLTSNAKSLLDEGRLDELERIVESAEGSAREKVNEFLKERRPRLFVHLPKRGFQEDSWNRYRVEVENRGNLGAKDVDVKLDGDFEVKGLKPISEIDVNEKRHLDVGIKPNRSGETPIDASVSYRRPFDDKNYETYDQEKMDVASSRTYLVEDVFLIHNQGNLVVHESRKYREDLDEKAFSTMIGAVQSFVKDSFSEQGGAGLSKLDFGDSKVLIERGKSVHLAAVVLGDEPRLLSLYIVEILNEIEKAYGEALLDWNRSMEGLEGIREVVRKLLFMSELGGADLGALEDSRITEAFGLGRQARPTLTENEAESVISDISREIEEMGYEHIWEKMVESLPAQEGELPAGITRDEAYSTLSVEILKSEVGELDDEEKLREYLALINEVTSAVTRARSDGQVSPEVPVRVAVLPDTQETMETVETFERIIRGEANIRNLETVPVGDEWEGLEIEAIPHLDMITGKYRYWARKIEMLLKSQSAWKIKRGIDKGAYFLGIEGQSVEISPSMVSFEILLPDNVVRQKFSGGSIYVSFPPDEGKEDPVSSPGLAEQDEADEPVEPSEPAEQSIASEIAGRIQEMRMDMSLGIEQPIIVKIHASESLIEELEPERERIAQETNSSSLEFVSEEDLEGEDGYTIEWQVADETFMITVRQSEDAGSPA
jgi:hypothetical protein